MRKSHIVWLLLIMATVVLCSGPAAFGQAVTGTLTGYVTDPSGAAIPNANVNATEVHTNVITARATDSTGLYLITNLVPGDYNLSAEARGFKTFIQRQIHLEVDATVRTDAKLELGEVTQQITVEAHGAALETEKTDVSRKFTSQDVDSLPELGRNATELFALVPGAIIDTYQTGPGENPNQDMRVFVNGSWSGAQYASLDGITDLEYGWSGYSVILPIQDSIQEMKITTADYDPEFGSTAGMVVQYVTKSGMNSLHGSLFYFNRNSDDYAADPITQKIAGTGPTGKGLGVSPENFNQFGGSLGGPIKKNKVFLFGATQWNRDDSGYSLIGTVPNAAFRSGDFSSLASTYPIYDPTTGNPDGTGRTQFSCGGVLNKMCGPFDKVATNLLGILPLPNTGPAGATDANYVGSTRQLFNQWQVDTRADFIATEKDKMFVRYSMFKAHLDNGALFGVEAGGPSGGGLSPEDAHFTDQLAAINWTHSFGTSLLTEVRAGVSRFRLDGYNDDSNLETNNKLGIPVPNTGVQMTGGLAGITVGGPVGGWFMGIQSGVAIPRIDRTTNFQWVNNWSWIRGAHQLRFGGEATRERFNFIGQNASTRGNYIFSQSITGTGDPTVPTSGLGMATFLLGMPSEFDRSVALVIPEERQTRFGIYGQDTWRATKKLTLSLGLRWDKFTPITSPRPGGVANFDPDTGNILLGGLGNIPKNIYITTPNVDFAPRLGIAYRLTAETVLRAGLGRSFFTSGYNATFHQLTDFYPLIAAQDVNQPSIYQDVFPLDQAPPPASLPALPSSGILPAPDGQYLGYRPRDWNTETQDSWNFTIERRLFPDTTLSVAYVGSKTTHLSTQENINSAPIGPGPLLQRRPYYALYGLSQQIINECNCDDANFNSFQVQVKKSYAKDLTFTTNFVWEKALGHNFDDPYNKRLDYGVGGGFQNTIDRAANFTLGHIIVLPYGKGQRWGSDATGIKKAAIAGWQFSGVTVLASGGAITPYMSSTATTNSDFFFQRPDKVSGCNPYNVAGGQNATHWYNPACFTTPAMYTLGNAGVGSLRGPGIANADFALWKEFNISTILSRENTAIQLRMEAYNVFNSTNLGYPNNYVDTGTAAGEIFDLEAGYPMRRFEFGVHISW